MSPLKLVFLLFDYFPYGGLQRDCIGVARACHARGHRVHIMTRRWQGERLSFLEVTEFGRHGLTLLQRNRRWLREVHAELAKRHFDGVVGFNKMPGLDVYFGADPCFVAKAARLKPFWYGWTRRYRHYRALEKSVFRRGAATRLLLLTPLEIPLYQQHYGTELERFEVLPPGIRRIESTNLQRQQMRQLKRAEMRCAETALVVLFVGSGFRVKGLDRLIEAFAGTAPNCELWVAGENPPGRFAWLARRHGVSDRVHFLGGRSDVLDLMMAADLLALPSRSESAGMVLLEAMTVGLPVLTTASCGYAFHIEKAGAGCVLPEPFNQAQLNRILLEMLTSPEHRGWSEAGLAYAAKEDLYSCHERAAVVIETVVATKARSSC